MPSATRLPVVLVQRPRCPTCASVNLRIRRTLPRDPLLPKVKQQLATCRQCGKKIKIVAD